MELVHYTPVYFKKPRHPITINVIGAGGTGSMILTRLARYNQARIMTGLVPLHVTAFDPKKVTENNIGRQSFTISDIGLYKSDAMIYKINGAFGFKWIAEPTIYETNLANIIIICTDTVHSRIKLIKEFQEIDVKFKTREDRRSMYLIDIGNELDYGQILLHSKPINQPDGGVKVLKHKMKYRDDKIEVNRDTSCDTYQSRLDKQSLFINDWMSLLAIDIVQEIVEEKKIYSKGVFFNLKKKIVKSIKI